MLKNGDIAGTLDRLMAVRHPIYSEANLTVLSRAAPHDEVVLEILSMLALFLQTSKAA
jgi:shikimate kinase